MRMMKTTEHKESYVLGYRANRVQNRLILNNILKDKVGRINLEAEILTAQQEDDVWGSEME